MSGENSMFKQTKKPTTKSPSSSSNNANDKSLSHNQYEEGFVARLKAMPGGFLEVFMELSLYMGVIPEIIKHPEIQAIYQNAPMLRNQAVFEILFNLECHFKNQPTAINKAAMKTVEFMYDYAGLQKFKELPKGYITGINAGDTLTHFAAKNQNKELLEYLAEKNLLEPSVKNAEGCYPIQYTAYASKVKNGPIKNIEQVLSPAGKFLLPDSQNVIPKSINDTFFVSYSGFSVFKPVADTTKQLVDYTSALIDVKSKEIPEFNAKLFLERIAKIRTIKDAFSSDFIDVIERLPLALLGAKDPFKALGLLGQYINYGKQAEEVTSLLAFLYNQVVKTPDYVLKNQTITSLKEVFFKIAPDLEKNNFSTVKLAEWYKVFAQFEYRFEQSYEEFSIHINKAVSLCNEIFLDEQEKIYLVCMTLQSAKVLGDWKYAKELANSLRQIDAHKDLVTVLDHHIKLATGEVEINDLFQDAQDLKLLEILQKVTDRYKFNEESDSQDGEIANITLIEDSLWLDMVLEYAIANDRIEEGLGLIMFLEDQNVRRCVSTSNILVTCFDQERAQKTLTSLDKDSPDIAQKDMSWNLIKILVSVYHNNIQQYTFDAIENVSKFLASGKKYGPELKNTFAAGCKLVAEHLLDQEGDNIEKIAKYLQLAKEHGTKDLALDYFKLTLKRHDLNRAKTELEELQKVAAQEKTQGDSSLSDKLEKFDSTKVTIQSFADLLVTTSEEKEENADDRAVEADQLMRNFIHPVKNIVKAKEKTTNSFELKIKGHSYKYYDKDQSQKKQEQASKVYKIKDNSEVYAVLSFETANDTMMNSCFSALEHGIDWPGDNKIIKTSNYYKIRTNYDDRIYSTSEYKADFNGKQLTLVVFDKIGTHKTIKALHSEKMKIQDWPSGDFSIKLIGAGEGSSAYDDDL